MQSYNLYKLSESSNFMYFRILYGVLDMKVTVEDDIKQDIRSFYGVLALRPITSERSKVVFGWTLKCFLSFENLKIKVVNSVQVPFSGTFRCSGQIPIPFRKRRD